MTEEEQRYDVLGLPLNIGDVVVTAETMGRSSASLGFGVVEGFTPKFVVLSNYKGSRGSSKKAINKIMVITDQITANKENYPELMI